MDDRLLPATLVIAFLLLLLALMYIGFRRRQRRQRDLPRPRAVPDDPGTRLLAVEGFYVATTLAGQPLERVAIGGLGFRGRVNAVVFDGGVVLGIAGEPDIFLPSAEISAVERSTYTIDRVVEPGGLVKIAWQLGDRGVDSFLRITDTSGQAALLTAIDSILTGPVTTGQTGGEG